MKPIFLFIGLVTAFAACKKCETCTYNGTQPVTNQPVNFTYNEECSKTQKRFNRDECEYKAQFYNGQCTCTEN